MKNVNFESVLLLLSLGIDVNARTHCDLKLNALHINAQAGGEMIMRNLVCFKLIIRLFNCLLLI